MSGIDGQRLKKLNFFLSNIHYTSCIYQIEDDFRLLSTEFDITFFTYMKLNIAGVTHEPEFIIGDAYHPWPTNYAQEELYKTDHTIRYGFNRHAAYTDKDVIDELPIKTNCIAVYQQAIDFNLKGWLIVPLEGEQNAKHYFTMAGKNFRSDKFSPESTALTLAATAIHSRIQVIKNTDLIKRPSLTTREHDVINYIVDGFTVQEIANKLGISENSVRNHLNNLKIKAKARTPAQLAAQSMRYKWTV